jgi:hypothetical protein
MRERIANLLICLSENLQNLACRVKGVPRVCIVTLDHYTERKIEVIKLVRELTGMRLGDAKDAVDGLTGRNGLTMKFVPLFQGSHEACDKLRFNLNQKYKHCTFSIRPATEG